MEKYTVIYNISGRASVEIEASSLKEATLKAKNLEIIENSENLIEWSYEDIEEISEEMF